MKLRDIWRTCNKIRAAIFRVGLNLWDYYKPLDPNGNNLLSGTTYTYACHTARTRAQSACGTHIHTHTHIHICSAQSPSSFRSWRARCGDRSVCRIRKSESLPITFEFRTVACSTHNSARLSRIVVRATIGHPCTSSRHFLTTNQIANVFNYL